MHSIGIGNDIIDLQLAKSQSNWQRIGFLEKQFSQAEQKIILNSKNPFVQVWLFWSMKEAAYKCYVQDHSKRFFAPKKIECKLISKTEGIVNIENKIYFSRSAITENYIHTIVSEKVTCASKINVLFHKQEVTGKMLNDIIRTHFNQEIDIQKNEFGVPCVYQKKEKLPISISKSHHGNYGAYVIAK